MNFCVYENGGPGLDSRTTAVSRRLSRRSTTDGPHRNTAHDRHETPTRQPFPSAREQAYASLAAAFTRQGWTPERDARGRAAFGPAAPVADAMRTVLR